MSDEFTNSKCAPSDCASCGLDHFPQILAQDPDSTPTFRRRTQIMIPRIDLRNIPCIIRIQIKIRNPVTEKFHITAMKSYDCSFLGDLEILISRDQLVSILFCLPHPETLAGLTDFSQTEIIQFYSNHFFSPTSDGGLPCIRLHFDNTGILYILY